MTYRNSQRLYSAVLDPHGVYPMQAERLVWSLIDLCNVAPDRIVLHVLNSAGGAWDWKWFESQGVQIRSIESPAAHPWCRKLQQLDSLLNDNFSDVVLLDCDIVVKEPPPSADGCVWGKPVDSPNPPLSVLRHVYELAGLHLSLSKVDLTGEPTARGNVNGGVYVVDHAVFQKLAPAWQRWAAWCHERQELFGGSWMHVDQVSFSMAVASERLPFQELDRRFNFPTHIAGQRPEMDRDPAIFHYHSAVDTQQFLLPVEGLPRASAAIERINTQLKEARRKRFNNQTFWNARYCLNPELGSGLGSRGEVLLQKQALLAEVARLVGAKSIVDVAGGDGQTVSALDARISIEAFDIAPQSQTLYKQAVPRAVWQQHDIVRDPIPNGRDLVLCFDMLIHLSSEAAYRAAIRHLCGTGTPVLLSGFETPPMNFGPMTFFHEPLSVSLAREGLEAVPVSYYRECTVFLALPASLARLRDGAQRIFKTDALKSA